ncbi:MAG TPA: class I SAM-dependent methyltransferase [Polyangiaceae bacterium]|nr:class I SAM-dependent methyltransferase [Polyangiaceae bacterium]
MTQSAYIFQGTPDAAELARLQMLEAVFDDPSQRCIRSVGPLLGSRCLEVGAGAGSIAAWLASEVGASGAVVAVDTNTRFLGGLPREVQVIEGELSALALPAGSFDLVHSRYVLIHNANTDEILDAMFKALKPGGALILEEPDFSSARAFTGPPPLRQAFDNVQKAIRETFSARGMDHAFGSALPELLEKRGAKLRTLEYDCPVASGGSRLAEMMRLSTIALQEKYLATGLVTPTDIANYGEFAKKTSCWANYYATVRIGAEKGL